MFTTGICPAAVGLGPFPGDGPTLLNVNDPNRVRLPRLSAIPAARSRQAVLQVRFYLLFGTLILAALAGLFAVYAWLTFQPPDIDVTDANPRGRAIAEQAAVSYLAGAELDLPVGPGGGLGRNESEQPPVAISGPPAWERFDRFNIIGVPVESHRFLFHRQVTDPQGRVSLQLMELTVLVGVPEDGTPYLAAVPQFAPAAYPDSELVTDYSNAPLAQTLPANGVTQLRTWASAWAADDFERLKLLTGDKTDGVRYVGLGGYRLSELRILSAIPVGDDVYLTRARLVLVGANESILEMDMDVTISAASSGSPNVTGWGPAGSGVREPSDVRIGAAR